MNHTLTFSNFFLDFSYFLHFSNRYLHTSLILNDDRISDDQFNIQQKYYKTKNFLTNNIHFDYDDDDDLSLFKIGRVLFLVYFQCTHLADVRYSTINFLLFYDQIQKRSIKCVCVCLCKVIKLLKKTTSTNPR